jgi:hypothetical protein
MQFLSASPADLFVGHNPKELHITKVVYNFGCMPAIPPEISKQEQPPSCLHLANTDKPGNIPTRPERASQDDER